MLQNPAESAESKITMSGAPFDRVENGYDPSQVAQFAAQALAWKRELREARTTLARYERIIGEIDAIEREAAGIVDRARAEANRIVAEAHARAGIASAGLVPREGPVEQTHEPDPGHRDPGPPAGWESMTREEKIEAAREHLFRRRGIILPQE